MSTNIAKGIEIARKATEYDTRGDYAKASELYVKSLDHFMAALKAERDPTRKDIIRNKIKEYLDRAEFIKRNFLHSGAASDPPTDPHPHQRCHSYSPTAPPAPAPVPPSAPLQQPGTATGGYYEQLIMQSMRYNDIVQECRRRRTKFTDPLFKADTSSLFKGSPTKDALELSREVVWMRATEKMGGRVSMFQQSIDPCDVVQGSLGDCWFLGALSLIALEPERLIELVPEHSDELGIYKVSFYRNRTRVSIVVDDYLPCYPGGMPCFAKNKDKRAFWVSIIEKAYAKMCGSYYAMESGSETDALVDFTGGLGFLLELKEDLPAETVWRLLLSYSRQRFLLGCANNKDREICGIIPSHAYGILGMHTVPLEGSGGNSNRTVPLLRLRNPWGNSEWQGDWSDHSPLWRQVSAGVKREIEWSNDPNDGTFFMALPDFLQCFEKIYLCKTLRDGLVRVDVTSRWEAGRSAGGCSNCPTWMCNPQYAITVREPTQGFVVLTQGDVRKFGEKSGGGYVNSIGAMVFESCSGGFRLLTRHKAHRKDREAGTHPGVPGHLAASSTYANVRERTIPVSFDPEKCPYIVVPAIFEAGTAANFRLSIFADAAARPTLDPVREWPYSVSLQGAWTQDLCGGCPNNSSWRANPHFGLWLYPRSSSSAAAGSSNESAGDITFTLSTAAAARDLDSAPSVGICVIGDGDVIPNDQAMISSKKFSQNAFTSGSFPVGLQKPLIVVPCTFDPGFQGTFFLSAYSAAPFKLVPL